MQLSVVLPCFNEVENIQTTVTDVLQWFEADGIDGDVIAVDDGSTDGTGLLLDSLAGHHPCLQVVHHKANLGYGSAVRSGCDRATKAWIAFMDSDGQFRAVDLRRLVVWMDQFEVIVGRRHKRADRIDRHLYAGAYAILVFLVLRIRVRDINCAMKLFRRSLWTTIRPDIATGALFNAEVFYNLKQNGIPWRQVAVDHYPRRHGQQSGSAPQVILTMFRDLWRLQYTVRR
ncbi:MAG: glycosyltransferase family 2 protein [bacterium]|nr:glycosyltransferase family 2 protein [bacterium]